MSTESQPYHHGDLRNTLIQIGLEVLAEDGMQSLSLRKVARRAGVSHNAPYMHFANKEALLAAVAEAGFNALEKAMREALEQTSKGSSEQLSEVGRAYVTFALEHPQHFQVMFVDLGGTHQGLERAARETFALLSATLTACQVAGTVREGAPHTLATAVWATMHGLSTLLIAQRLSPWLVQGHPLENLPETLLDVLYRGLREPE